MFLASDYFIRQWYAPLSKSYNILARRPLFGQVWQLDSSIMVGRKKQHLSIVNQGSEDMEEERHTHTPKLQLLMNCGWQKSRKTNNRLWTRGGCKRRQNSNQVGTRKRNAWETDHTKRWSGERSSGGLISFKKRKRKEGSRAWAEKQPDKARRKRNRVIHR